MAFNDIEFGKFSGNMNLMKWFKSLCRMYKVQGRAYYMWRTQGETKTVGVDRQLALEKLEAGLRTDKTSFIYHCYDHYFAPIGYEITPWFGPEAYLPYEDINQDKAVHWIIIGEPAKPHPFFTVRKWDDIANVRVTMTYLSGYRVGASQVHEYPKNGRRSQGVQEHFRWLALHHGLRKGRPPSKESQKGTGQIGRK